MRPGAPFRRPGAPRGRLPADFASAQARLAALARFDDDILAPGSQASADSRLRTMDRILKGWGLAMYPPTLVTIRALGTTLKWGDYRAAEGYIMTYKAAAQRKGHSWGDLLHRAAKDAIRSCERGLGPPTRAQALPLHRLGNLRWCRNAWTPEGPACPRSAMVVGAWWLLREVELSTLRAAHAEVVDVVAGGRPVVRLTLPASKTDQMALGSGRAHRCICTTDPGPGCPVHAVLDQLLWLRRTFPGRHVGGRPDLDLPLFPTPEGGVVAKGAMVDTIVHAARQLRVPPSPDGTERPSGHSLRATGAQGLIALGWTPESVRLQGRWASEAVDRYTRLAPLAAQLSSSSCSAVGHDLANRTGAPAEPLVAEAALCTAGGEEVGREWLLNTSSRKHHLLLPPGHPNRGSRAVCGWLYVDCRHATLPRGLPEPQLPWEVCTSCAPSYKAALKTAGRVRASSS